MRMDEKWGVRLQWFPLVLQAWLMGGMLKSAGNSGFLSSAKG